MTISELFKIRVIELIHLLPYDQAIKKEKYITPRYDSFGKQISKEIYYPRPITLGRVLQAVQNANIKNKPGLLAIAGDFDLFLDSGLNTWKFVNSDRSECTDEDQTDETIEKLYNLIK